MTYNGLGNLTAKTDYLGEKKTETLEITATTWGEGKWFDASFVKDSDKTTGCGVETASLENSFFTNAAFQKPAVFDDADGEDAEFFLTGEGEMLVTDGNGNRLGYDPKTNRYYDEIPDNISE